MRREERVLLLLLEVRDFLGLARTRSEEYITAGRDRGLRYGAGACGSGMTSSSITRKVASFKFFYFNILSKKLVLRRFVLFLL